jgi:Rrf2 family protein
MALLYAKPTEHAIRALIYLALREEDRLVSVQEIAESEGISPHHLSKVMKILARRKIVHAIRGPGGGYRLRVSPETITLWNLVEIFGGEEAFHECALGWTACRDDNPCPLHDRWVLLKEKNQNYLSEVTIAELAVAALDKGAAPRFIGTA